MRSCLQDGHLLWTRDKCYSPWLGKTLHQWNNLLLENRPASWGTDFTVTGHTVAWLICHLQIPEAMRTHSNVLHFHKGTSVSIGEIPLSCLPSESKDSRVGSRTLDCQHSGGQGRGCRGSRPVSYTARSCFKQETRLTKQTKEVKSIIKGAW